MAGFLKGAVRLNPGNPYMERLVKLIPIEIVTLFVTFQEIAATWPAVLAWTCLGLVILLRTEGTSGLAGESPQWKAVFVACVSFALWVHAMGGYLIQVDLPPGSIEFAIAVWTIFVPLIYNPK